MPTFSKARYFVQRAEWEHALHATERDQASYLEEWFVPAESQTELVEGACEIVPGVSVELAPGHTHDMQCVWIESEGKRACFISDLVPTHVHIPYPWIMAFDLYPMDTLASRKRLLPQLARKHVLVVFPHDAESPWGVLSEVDGTMEFQAVSPT